MTSAHHAPDHSQEEIEDHDLGLAHDLPQIVERQRAWGRRSLLGLVGGIGVVAVAGCAAEDGGTTSGPSSSSDSSGPPPDGGAGSGSSVDVAAGEIPEEAAGPYPGNGSNGPDVLAESGVVRTDITTSFGSASGIAGGVPITVKLRVFDLDGDEAAPLAGAAVYLWHCDREGRYSLYSDGVTGENYLRGVQEADTEGRLEFTTIYPGCYAGRWPHMHFEVYESLAMATSADSKLRTSQLALPQDVCEDVYGSAEGYETSVDNLAQLSLDTDGIFSDGYSLQMAKATGSVDEGFTVSLNVPV